MDFITSAYSWSFSFAKKGLGLRLFPATLIHPHFHLLLFILFAFSLIFHSPTNFTTLTNFNLINKYTVNTCCIHRKNGFEGFKILAEYRFENKFYRIIKITESNVQTDC